MTQEIKEIYINIENDNTKGTGESENVDNKSDPISSRDIEKLQEVEGTESPIYSKSLNSKHGSEISKDGTPYGYVGGAQEDLPMYWVQFNFSGGSAMPDSGMPLDYQPDRNVFVRVVFSIVLFMLILTAGFVIFVYMTDAKYIFRRHGIFIMVFGLAGMIFLNFTMMCSACTRRPPCNFVCLFLAVCFMSLIAAYITVRYRTQIVFLAILATMVTVIVCLCLACSSFDFTRFLLYIIVVVSAFGALAMLIFITMLLTKIRYKPLTLAILIIGTVLNVIVLTVELQMILGGRTVELSEDDYALGAFMLYTSIVDIFLKLVQIMGIVDG